MSGSVAALAIGAVLLVTMLVGMAAQSRSRRSSGNTRLPRSRPVATDAEEDLSAANRSVEEARAELLWLRDQVVKERARLDQLKRQAEAFGSAPASQQTHHSPGPQPHQRAGPAPSLDSPWVILGLRPGSSSEDIRRRYRLLSRVWHPDRFADGPPELRAEAETMMARLNRANTLLGSQTAGTQR